MIEICPSQDGRGVIKYNEKFLSSSKYPERASKKWMKRCREKYFINHSLYEVIFLIGAGSGYEAVELCKSFPESEVVIIDTSPILIDHVMRLHPILRERVTTFCVSSLTEIYTSNFIRDLLKRYYIVLSSVNIMRSDSFMLEKIKDSLKLRNIDSFSHFINTQEEKFKEKFDQRHIKKQLRDNEGISILHLLEGVENNKTKGGYLKEILLTLKELIV